MLKFKNGLEVDECTECWASGGYFDDDDDWIRCDCCGGTGYDSNDYLAYMHEQAELESEKKAQQLFSEVKMYPEQNAPEHNPFKYAEIAGQWLADNPVILDTETTGLDSNAEVVEVSIIDSSGKALLDTLIKPLYPIPEEVIRIHGITNEMVKDAPIWPDVHETFCEIIKGRKLLIYNAEYDQRIIHQTLNTSNNSLPENDKKEFSFHELCPEPPSRICVMKLFAAFYGQWDDYREDWKWQKLTTAAEHMNVKVEGKAHRSLADCRMTLGILQAMAARVPVKPETKGDKIKDVELLKIIRNSKHSIVFDKLINGDTVGYININEADMALCSILSFWTKKDVNQIDRIFRSSKLYRPEWDEIKGQGKTYGQITIGSVVCEVMK